MEELWREKKQFEKKLSFFGCREPFRWKNLMQMLFAKLC